MAVTMSCGCFKPRTGASRVSRDEDEVRSSPPRWCKAMAAVSIAGLLCISPVDVNGLVDARYVVVGLHVKEANARGLFQMPPLELSNRYFLVRAGESEYESSGKINTNPVSKTSVDSGLSENGKKQTARAAMELKKLGACEGSCWIWPSITQRAYQAAEIIAYVNDIQRNRIVPEYSFLDARGLGAYEGKPLSAIAEVYQSDLVSARLRPPAYTDGTPNESVTDVLVRVKQLMSILETQYSGETIVIVSPDSDNLSILQAGLYGLDLRRHSDLAFAPGEVRLVDDGSIPPPRNLISGFIDPGN